MRPTLSLSTAAAMQSGTGARIRSIQCATSRGFGGVLELDAGLPRCCFSSRVEGNPSIWSGLPLVRDVVRLAAVVIRLLSVTTARPATARLHCRGRSSARAIHVTCLPSTAPASTTSQGAWQIAASALSLPVRVMGVKGLVATGPPRLYWTGALKKERQHGVVVQRHRSGAVFGVDGAALLIAIIYKAVSQRTRRPSPLAGRKIGQLPRQELVERVSDQENDMMGGVLLMYIALPVTFMCWIETRVSFLPIQRGWTETALSLMGVGVSCWGMITYITAHRAGRAIVLRNVPLAESTTAVH